MPAKIWASPPAPRNSSAATTRSSRGKGPPSVPQSIRFAPSTCSRHCRDRAMPSLAGPVMPGSALSAFLGVERSLSGRRWRQRRGDDRAGLALAQQMALPELVGRLLAARGVTEAEAAERFLTPRLRHSLPDPGRFRDMGKAVRRLVDAVLAGEIIAV